MASAFLENHGLNWPMALDTMDNNFETDYAAWPERLYILGAPEGEAKQRKLLFKSQPGPWGFDVDNLRAFMQAHSCLT